MLEIIASEELKLGDELFRSRILIILLTLFTSRPILNKNAAVKTTVLIQLHYWTMQ